MNTIITLYNKVFDFIYIWSNNSVKLFARIYVADAFFRAGLIKFQNWDSTLYLFENEYQVPFIPWEFAAYLGTATELILPILLLLGIATRLVALKLFFFNIIAVVSYSALWESGFYDHKLWGEFLLLVVIFGAGKFSLDAIIFKTKH